MSADHPGLAVELVRREPDLCVLALSGQLSPASAGLVTGAVSKALSDVGQVLVDVSGLRLTWTPAVHLFPSAMSAMGGWPWARLVLFGADARLAETLRAQQVSATVPLAPDQTTARQLLQRRPPSVARHLDLDQELSRRRPDRYQPSRVRQPGTGVHDAACAQPTAVTDDRAMEHHDLGGDVDRGAQRASRQRGLWSYQAVVPDAHRV